MEELWTIGVGSSGLGYAKMGQEAQDEQFASVQEEEL